MDNGNISFVAFESIIGRFTDANKRLWILCIFLLLALLITNAGWIVYESQFTHEMSVEQEIDSGEGDTIVNGIGDLIYGKDKTERY